MPFIRAKTRGMGVPPDLHVRGMDAFKTALLKDEIKTLSLGDAIAHVRANSRADRFLLPSFYKYITTHYPEETKTLKGLMEFSDLTKPADWYKEARRMQRKIILHLGPTNSGKTYAALKRLEECTAGIYCGPLRLLAHEVYERFNSKGVPCNLLTGEERRESDGVQKYAATVEMAPLNRKFEVAVLDEIQMIGDEQRGWAWAQGVLGIQADEIHLCGEPTIIPLIMEMAKDTGDTVEINRYERLTELKVSDNGLGGKLTSLKRGDCVVTFSRQNIFALKRAIEQQTSMRAAVIYGSLPPETRAEQAKQFNDPNGPYDVLVASDAIGMGLNLNIGRMVFECVAKFDGKEVKNLSISQTKQIAGRAGRFGTVYTCGEVCTLDDADMKTMKRLYDAAAPSVLAAGLAPSLEQIEIFAKYLPKEPLSALLERFQDLANLGGRYFLCNLDAQRKIAEFIESVPLTLRDRYTFILAPVDLRNPEMATQMRRFAEAQSEGLECHLDDCVILGDQPPQSIDELKDLEAQHRLIILYMWLSQRFPETFTDSDSAHHLKRRCEALIDRGLAGLKFERKKKLTGAAKKAAREEKARAKAAAAAAEALAIDIPPENAVPPAAESMIQKHVLNQPTKNTDRY
ncbi:RNA helicase [Geranomyces variabilis]|nr:RNA helicase [Geranomyces variabilis]